MKSLDCGRENDLISFLYDELEPAEKLEFGLHLQKCTGCSSHLTSFTDVRASVVEWRNESLGSMSSVYENAPVAEQRKPSALAAIREFFNLSPLWMKASVAFASLLFCLFAGLAVARFAETSSRQPTVAAVNSNTESRDEFNKRVEQRVQDELQRRATVQQVATIPSNPVIVSQRRSARATQFVSASSKKQAGRPLSRVERQELAVDLGLIDDGNDSELVLIGDRLNQ